MDGSKKLTKMKHERHFVLEIKWTERSSSFHFRDRPRPNRDPVMGQATTGRKIERLSGQAEVGNGNLLHKIPSACLSQPHNRTQKMQKAATLKCITFYSLSLSISSDKSFWEKRWKLKNIGTGEKQKCQNQKKKFIDLIKKLCKSDSTVCAISVSYT